MELEFHRMDLKYEGLRIVDERREAKLMASLAQHGQLDEVLVVKGQEGKFVLIDGYRRVGALRRLGRDTVRAQILSMSEQEALFHAWRLEEGTKRTALEEGWLLREVGERHRMNQVEMSVKLQRSVSWVCRRLAMVQALPEKVQDLVRRGKICPYAASKYLVPLARAKPEHCEKLVEGIKGHGLGARQIGRLYGAWQSSGSKQRLIIIDQPILFLRAQEEASRPEPPSVEEVCGAAMHKEIEALGGFCRGLRKKLKQQVRIEGKGWIDEKLRHIWRETLADMKSFILTAGEIFDVGNRHAHGNSAAAREGTRDPGHCAHP